MLKNHRRKMSLKIDLTGKRFGRLIVLNDTQKRSGGSIVWLCQCDCGKKKPVSSRHLLNTGHVRSCGCYRRELMKKIKLKHGDAKRKNHHRVYETWSHMKKRCNNKNFDGYKYYGHRGIRVCKEWQDNYLIFKNWALSHGYKPGLVIDRINNNGNYEPIIVNG